MKIDRLIGILSVLLRRDQVTAPYLAEKFEVSRRTIQRDIESLCRAGIPIATSQGRGGGISIMEGYRVDRALLTNGELRSILAGLRSLDSVSGTHRYERLMEKLCPEPETVLPGDEWILIDLASWYKPALSEKIEVIHRGIEEQKLISFHYESPKGSSERSLEPHYLIFQWANWYVWGWCRKREDFRLFKLNRMSALSLGGDFQRRSATYPDLSANRVFPQNYLVKALVNKKYKWRLLEEFGADSFAEEAGGNCLFSFAFTDKNAALAWILSFQGDAELLEPAELREELAAIGKKLCSRHQT